LPFKSRKEEKFMFSQHPDIAKRWVAEAKSKGQSPCPTCGGRGETLKSHSTMGKAAYAKCKTCGGSGMMAEEKGEGKKDAEKGEMM
jgi:DnaJ-class molecular chaperone